PREAAAVHVHDVDLGVPVTVASESKARPVGAPGWLIVLRRVGGHPRDARAVRVHYVDLEVDRAGLRVAVRREGDAGSVRGPRGPAVERQVIGEALNPGPVGAHYVDVELCEPVAREGDLAGADVGRWRLGLIARRGGEHSRQEPKKSGGRFGHRPVATVSGLSPRWHRA